MREEAMGSDLIDVMEAAELLGVSHRSVHHFVRQGLLKPRYPRGRKLNAPELFLRDEVCALVEAREKRFDFRYTGTIAMQAHASSRALERRVEFLEQLLGRSFATLSLDEEDIVALYAEAKEGVEVPPIDVTGVMRWAGIFLSMGEEFLELLASATNDIESWKVFLDLSAAMLRDAPLDTLSYDKELEAAYGYFRYARESLRRVMYFHVRNQYGPQTAGRTLTVPKEDVHEGVLRLLGGVFRN